MQDPSAFLQPPAKLQFPEQERLKCPRCDSTNTKFCYYNNYNLSQPRHFCKNCRRYWTKGGALRNIPVGGGTRKIPKRPSAANNSKRHPSPGPAEGEGSADARSPRLIDPNRTPSQPAAVPVPHPSHSPAQIVHEGGSGMLSLGVDPERRLVDAGGSFSSFLASNLQYGALFEGLNRNSSEPKVVQFSGLAREDVNSRTTADQIPGRALDHRLKLRSSGGTENDYLSLHNSNGSGSNGSEEPSCWGNSSGWPDLAINTPTSRFQ